MSDKLQGLHPSLISKANQVISAMTALGFPMVVVQGVRTTEQQQALFAQGRTVPGHIVTNCDGVKIKSNHQLKADGFGHAVDVAFKVLGQVSFDIKLPWKAYGECGKAIGLVWGGDFSTIKDLDHLELP